MTWHVMHLLVGANAHILPKSCVHSRTLYSNIEENNCLLNSLLLSGDAADSRKCCGNNHLLKGAWVSLF